MISDSSPEMVTEPFVESPYEGKILSTGDHFKLSAYWFATNFLWGALLTIMLPGEIRHLAPHYRIIGLSLFTGLSALVALLVPLIAGALSDRCTHRWGRRRPYMVGGMVINVAGLILMAISFQASPIIPGRPHGEPNLLATAGILLSNPGFLFFMFSYMVVQFGNNVTSAAYSGVIPDLVPPSQRGAASGYMALTSQLGTLCGVIGSGVLFGGQPEFVKFALVTVVLVGVGMVTILGIKEIPLSVSPPKLEWLPYIKSLWIDPRKYPDFAWVWITRALVMLGFYGILPFVNYYLIDVIGSPSPEKSASMLIAIILLASSGSGVYGGYVSDRIGRKRVVYIANCIIAAMSIAFIFCRNMEQVLFAGILFGLGFGAYTSVDWALGTDVLPSKKDAAKEMAVWHVAMTLPQSIAAPVAGIMISAFGKFSVHTPHGEEVHYTIAGYSSVFLLCAVCFALGAFLLRNVKGVS